MVSSFFASAIARKVWTPVVIGLLVISLFAILGTPSVQAEDGLDLPEENWPVYRVGLGHSPEIAIDKDGKVHLAYLNSVDDWNGTHKIMYSTFSNGQVITQDLNIEGDIRDLRMVLDPNGSAHVCYIVSGDLFYLMYATNADGDWNVTMLSPFVSSSLESLDMAMDQEGYVHIVAYSLSGVDYETASELYELYYASNEGTEWKIDLLGTYHGNLNGYEPPCARLAFDDQGDLHLAYLSRSEFSIHSINTTERIGDVWQNNRSLSVGGYSPQFSLQVDENGWEHMLYGSAPYEWDLNGTYDLAVWTGVEWSVQLVGQGYMGCQLMIDEEGREHIGYVDERWVTIVGHRSGSEMISCSISPCFYYTWMDVPDGDFMARHDNITWMAMTDLFTGEVIIAHSVDGPSPYPYFSNIYKTPGKNVKYTFEWDPVDTGTEVSEYLVQSFVLHDDLREICADLVFTSDTTSCTIPMDNGETWLRLSAITGDGEEYLGGLGFVEYSGNLDFDIGILLTILLVVGAIVIGVIAFLYFARPRKGTRPPGRL